MRERLLRFRVKQTRNIDALASTSRAALLGTIAAAVHVTQYDVEIGLVDSLSAAARSLGRSAQIRGGVVPLLTFALSVRGKHDAQVVLAGLAVAVDVANALR